MFLTVFGASFKSIAAKAYYPGNDQQAMGGGEMRDVKIPAHSHNTLFFPFNIKCVCLCSVLMCRGARR